MVGPEGFSNTFEVFEFTAGGRWKFVMHGPDGNSYSNESFFEELVPDAKIVIHHDCLPNFKLTVDLTPVSDGTHLTWVQVFEDAATAQAVKQRAGSANEQNIDRLIHVLTEAAFGQEFVRFVRAELPSGSRPYDMAGMTSVHTGDGA